MRKILLLIIVSVLFICNSINAQNTYKSKLSKDTILIGDRVELSMKLNLKESEECTFQEPADPITQGVETIQKIKIDTTLVHKGILDIEGKMILTSFDSGSYVLPPVVALVSRGNGNVDTLIFSGSVLEVKTIPIDTATFKPFDIKGQIKYPLTLKELLPWLGLMIIVIILTYILIRYIKYRKENKTFFGRPIVKDPPHIIALRELEKIRGQKLWQNNKQKYFYTLITDVLREYIASRYDIPAMEQTSNELFSALSDKNIQPKLYDELKNLFSTADYVKFAKHAASNDENEEAIPTAVRFVNATFMQELENKKGE